MSETPRLHEMLEADALFTSFGMVGLDLADVALASDWASQVGPERFAKIVVAMVAANGERKPITVSAEHMEAMNREVSSGRRHYSAAANIAKEAFANPRQSNVPLPATEKSMAEQLVKQYRRAKSEAGSENKRAALAAQTAAALDRAKRRSSAAVALAPSLCEMREAGASLGTAQQLLATHYPALLKLTEGAVGQFVSGLQALSNLFSAHAGKTKPPRED